MKIKSKLKIILSILLIISFNSSISFSAGKIYGTSKTASKEYFKYEKCLLKQTLENVKDGEKDGYKCIYKRQMKGKEVTIFQPSGVCLKSFKCKRENQ